MLLGAVIDAGVELERIVTVLAGMGLEGWRITAAPVVRGRVAGTGVVVQVDRDDAVVRTWANVRELVRAASLPESVRRRSLSAFARLTAAEAQIAGRGVESVHFSQSAAVDAIIEVVGCCVGLHLLGVESVTCSAVAQGTGMVRDEHGLVPVPAPAVLELLRGAPTYSTAETVELCTPTAAALLAEWADRWGPMPPLVVERVGYGAGSRELDRPNVLRLVVGEAAEQPDAEPVMVLSAVIAGLSSPRLRRLLDRMRQAGAVEGWGRPLSDAGTHGDIEVLCVADRSLTASLTWILLRSGAAAVHSHPAERRALRAEDGVAEVAGHRVRVRVTRLGATYVDAEPDAGDCAAAAADLGLAVEDVAAEARIAWRRTTEAESPPPPSA
jgi:pyridinium-3,5-bisthiocarboxylic acid mononucleotide nickel chelatase